MYVSFCFDLFSCQVTYFVLVGESKAPSASDPIAMMEFYMKKAAQEERQRQPKQSKDEMPPPASLQGPGYYTFFRFLFFIIFVVYILL